MSVWLTVVPLALFAVSASIAFVGFCVQAADRNVPFRVDRRTVAMIAREAGARIVLAALDLALWPVPDVAPGPVAGAERRRVPVLLVPGLHGSAGSLWPLATFLRQRGYAAWATPRRSSKAGIALEAAALGRRVDALCARHGVAEVDLVAFSTGGLVAAWWLRQGDGARPRVRRFVAIGTPWGGTRTAVFGRGPAVAEVRFGSHVLDGLFPPPVPTTCVWSPDDPMVVPAASAAPDRGGALVQIDSGGHLDLLVSARVFRAVVAALEAPAAGAREPERGPEAPPTPGAPPP